MGGYGSGRWRDHNKAGLVEDALPLDIAIFRPNLQLDQQTSKGSLGAIGQASVPQWSASFTLQKAGPKQRLLRLTYFAVSEDGPDGLIADTVNLIAASNGWRFVCGGCGQKVKKLYMPLDQIRFLCRQCHHLVYRSAQQAHTLNGRYHQLVRWGLLPAVSI